MTNHIHINAHIHICGMSYVYMHYYKFRDVASIACPFLFGGGKIPQIGRSSLKKRLFIVELPFRGAQGSSLRPLWSLMSQTVFYLCFPLESHRHCLASCRRLRPGLSASAGLSPPASPAPRQRQTPGHTPTSASLLSRKRKKKKID